MPVNVSIDGLSGEFEAGSTLFACAEALGARPFSSCDQHGKCRECVLQVRKGSHLISGRTEHEAHLGEGYRLSCCAKLNDGEGVVELKSSSHGKLQIVESAVGIPASAAETPLRPAVKRVGGRVMVDGQDVGQAGTAILGMAVDLGTTSVALRVYDLETGELSGGAVFENPQRFGGSDIMSRIAYDCTHGGRLLQRVMLNGLCDALNRLPLDSGNIHEVVVAGNSTMRDLFFGLNVESIGQKPYHSVTEREMRAGLREGTSLSVDAKKLRLPVNPKARVYGMPLIGSHVGADTAACLLALEMDRAQRPLVLMDIGTNTEVACGDKGGLTVASCPAGPAFEGGAITCGMPGWEGAIERVRISEGGEIVCKVIGGTAPLGICGSGLIDALSEFRQHSILDEYGRYTDDAQSRALVPDAGISMHESDINELAQAKGANVAGLQILLKHCGMELEDIPALYLAGGFARYLDVNAARNIGLVPDLPADRIHTIGNATIEGACIALLNTDRRMDLEAYIKSAVHVELESDEAFFDHFVEGCLFKPYKNVMAFKEGG